MPEEQQAAENLSPSALSTLSNLYTVHTADLLNDLANDAETRLKAAQTQWASGANLHTKDHAL